MFDAHFFTHNRNKLLRTAGDTDLFVFSANGLLQRSVDTTFPFRQDSNFWYLSGCLVPDAVLVVSTKSTYIILPERLKHRDQWEGEIDTQAIKTESGVDVVYAQSQGWDVLKAQLQTAKKVGTILPTKAYEPNYGMHINPAKLTFGRRIRRYTKHSLIDARQIMAAIRQVKEVEEIEAIQQAVDITGKSLESLHKTIKTMHNENDVSIFLTYQFGIHGASGHGYDPVIASGKNSTVIHHEQSSSPLVQDELLLLDVGAQYGTYSADISRTWALQAPTKRQQEVHKAVVDVQNYAYSLIKPGVLLRTYEKQVRDFMKEQLVLLGLTDKNDQKDHLHFYPHLASHFLGVDVHDAGNYDSLLEPNMVITVEPGIYIEDEGIGVRIEDDIVITESGFKNLSAHIPTGLVY